MVMCGPDKHRNIRVGIARAPEGEEQTEAMRGAVRLARQAGAKVCVVKHEQLDEIGQRAAWDEVDFSRAVNSLDVPTTRFSAHLSGSPALHYTDLIHLNPRGQEALALAIRDCVSHAE
ncbi:MAG: hypothetical protein AAFQ67_09470 [Pseudomonadota bacterium]